jgi:ribosome-associated protein
MAGGAHRPTGGSRDPEGSRSGRGPGSGHDGGMQDVPISDDMIRLGQFLKLANVIDSGSDARILLEDGSVRVNGAPERRRGRQLRRGDVVTVQDHQVRVA